jgi:phosphoglycerate kinase
MRTLDDLIRIGVSGRRVLVRCDLNVPLSNDAKVADDGRIRAALPGLGKLLDHGARVVVAAHLGRPKGAPDPRYSLGPVADRLARLLGRPVEFALDTVGESARLLAGDLKDGELLLLENVRFNPGETSKDDAERADFAKCLALLTGGEDDGGAFVEDAFGAVHRRHASVYDVARLLPHYCGDLVRDEVAVLRELTGDPKRPYVVVLGGSKVSDKLAVINSLLPRVDKLLVGGGMCFTFLRAQGHEVGGSLLEADQVDACRTLLAENPGKIVLPADIVVAADVTDDAQPQTVAADAMPAGHKGLDIGPRTVELFGAELADAQTVFWNGPMGVFEVAPFAAGTRGVGEAIARVPGLSVVGGGDSAAAVRALALDAASFGHISTGGGASLEYLEGRTLPGIAVLEEV